MLSSLKRLFYRTAIWLLRRFNPGDIHLRHHYTHQRFKLDAFKHKGYWVHGKRRECNTMELFGELIRPGDTVFEAGGHIGYMSMYFGSLVGSEGSVTVFEPGPNNLNYLKDNISKLPQVMVVEKAVGAVNELRKFFVEDLTGQNNSLYSDYGTFKNNSAYINYDAGGYREIQVEVVTIDSFCNDAKLHPDFVKIDVEGAELEVLRGMSQTIATKAPLMMVEVTRQTDDVYALLTSQGYLLYSDKRTRLRCPDDNPALNVFCIHREWHKQELARLQLDSSVA